MVAHYTSLSHGPAGALFLVVHSKKLSLLYSSDASAFDGHCGGGVVFDLDRKRPFCRDSNCHLPQEPCSLRRRFRTRVHSEILDE